MPCRALEAFRRSTRRSPPQRQWFCLNALSGIGGVQTDGLLTVKADRVKGLNALSGIGGVQTQTPAGAVAPAAVRLNALSGIGGVQTMILATASPSQSSSILMPCRALEAFRLFRPYWDYDRRYDLCLNALSGIGGVQTPMMRA